MARYVLVKNGQSQGVIIWNGTTPLNLPAGVTATLESNFVGTIDPPLRQDEIDSNTIRQQAADAVDAMQAHIDRGTFTAQQTTNALILVLRVCVALVKYVITKPSSGGGAGGAQAQGFASFTVSEEPGSFVVNSPVSVLDLMAGRGSGSGSS